MRRSAVLLAATLATAACGRAAEAPEANVADAAANVGEGNTAGPNLAEGSWDNIFADPQTVLGLFGRIGLRPGPYERAGAGWRSEAQPTSFSDPSGADVVTGRFAASGSERRLESIEYRLIEPSRSNDQLARDAFDKWLAGSLRQLGVSGGDAALAAIHGTGRPSGRLKDGADYAVVRSVTPQARQVVVTFTRSAGTAAQTNQGRQ